MAIFYVNSNLIQTGKCWMTRMVPINTRSIMDGMLRVDPRKRSTHDLYLSLYLTITNDMLRVDFEEAHCV